MWIKGIGPWFFFQAECL